MSSHSQKTDREIGSLLRLYRVAMDISSEQLSKQSGLSVCQISAIERGRVEVSATNLINLTCALEISLPDLMFRLQARLGLKDQTCPMGTSQALALMTSNRGRQAVHALASCQDPKLVEALFDMIIASCVSEAVPNMASDREPAEEGM